MLAEVIAMMMVAGAQAASAAPAVNAQGAPSQPDVIDQTLQQVMATMHAGHNVEALAALDPMADAVTNGVSKATSKSYCANSAAEAVEYLARATPTSPIQLIQPRMCSVLFLRAYALENLHRLPEAIEQLRQLIVLEPNLPHYQVEYGSALRQAGDHAAALAAYRRAIEIAAPVKLYLLDQAAALRGIGFILTEQGDLDGAEKAYRGSLELAPGHPVALNELAYIARLRMTGKKASARTVESNIDPAATHMPDKKPSQ